MPARCRLNESSDRIPIRVRRRARRQGVPCPLDAERPAQRSAIRCRDPIHELVGDHGVIGAVHAQQRDTHAARCAQTVATTEIGFGMDAGARVHDCHCLQANPAWHLQHGFRYKPQFGVNGAISTVLYDGDNLTGDVRFGSGEHHGDCPHRIAMKNNRGIGIGADHQVDPTHHVASINVSEPDIPALAAFMGAHRRNDYGASHPCISQGVFRHFLRFATKSVAAYRIPMWPGMSAIGVKNPCMQAKTVFAVRGPGLSGVVEPAGSRLLFGIVALPELFADRFIGTLTVFDEQGRAGIAGETIGEAAKRRRCRSRHGGEDGSTLADMSDCCRHRRRHRRSLSDTELLLPLYGYLWFCLRFGSVSVCPCRAQRG